MQGAHWTLREFCSAFNKAAGEIGENTQVSERQAKRWLAGASELPRPQARRVLEYWLREPVDRLFGPPSEASPALIAVNTEELLMSAGREAADHALNAATALASAALEALHAEAGRLARAYFTKAPLELLGELVKLRDTVYQQLERTHKPRQRAELFLLAGQTCGLLSSVAFDLGHAEAAEELARAAYTYGDVIDHPSLCGWARALTMSVLLWSGRYHDVVNVATRAIELAPAGTPRARLFAVKSRALAYLGAADEVATNLGACSDELDRAGNDALMDGVGGELSFGHTRRALCAGAAHVALRDGERAEIEAAAAVEAFTAHPVSQRWRAGELAAQVDLSTARVLRGDLAGAEYALKPVLALPAEHRTEALTQRVTGLGRLVTAGSFRGAVEGVRIRDAVTTWASDTLPKATATLELPSASELPGV